MTPTPDGAERALGRDDTVTAEAKAETEVPLNPGIVANLVGTALKRGGTARTTLPVTASRSRPAILSKPAPEWRLGTLSPTMRIVTRAPGGETFRASWPANRN